MVLVMCSFCSSPCVRRSTCVVSDMLRLRKLSRCSVVVLVGGGGRSEKMVIGGM